MAYEISLFSQTWKPRVGETGEGSTRRWIHKTDWKPDLTETKQIPNSFFFSGSFFLKPTLTNEIGAYLIEKSKASSLIWFLDCWTKRCSLWLRAWDRSLLHLLGVSLNMLGKGAMNCILISGTNQHSGTRANSVERNRTSPCEVASWWRPTAGEVFCHAWPTFG